MGRKRRLIQFQKPGSGLDPGIHVFTALNPAVVSYAFHGMKPVPRKNESRLGGPGTTVMLRMDEISVCPPIQATVSKDEGKSPLPPPRLEKNPFRPKARAIFSPARRRSPPGAQCGRWVESKKRGPVLNRHRPSG